MTRLNPTAQAEAERPRESEEVIKAVAHIISLPVRAPFNPEQTRKAFEDDLIKAYLPVGLPEEELREQHLLRNPHFPDDYLDPHVDMEWTGWKNGVLHGYELWGKK